MPERHRWMGLLVVLSLVLGSIYWFTLAPGLTWANRGADGGDLITAAATGGVGHPSGYPIYLVLARLFQFLPIGSLAFRTNLMSAVCGLLAALLVADLTRRSVTGSESIRHLAGLLAGLGFGLSPLLWSQAVITEVYTLHALFVVLILWLMPFIPGTRILCFARPSDGGTVFLNEAWMDRIGGLLFGLALGNQLTVALLLPPWLLVGLLSKGTVVQRSGGVLEEERESAEGAGERFPMPPHLRVPMLEWGSLIRRLTWLAVGLLIYLTIPMRARSGPPVNWGNPVDMKGLWWLVSGQLYQDRVFGLELQYLWPRVRNWAGLLRSQYSFLGLAVGFYGLLYGKPRLTRFYWITGWMLLAYSVFAIGYNSSDSYTLLIPAFLAVGLWFSMGAATLLEASTKARWGAWLTPAGGLLLFVVIAANAWMNYSQVDASQVGHAEAFGREILAVAPRDSILLTQEDKDSFALWYFHYALGERPDLAVIIEPNLAYDWYRETLRTTYPDLQIPEIASSIEWRTIFSDVDRPLCEVHLGDTEMLCPNCAIKEGVSEILKCLP